MNETKPLGITEKTLTLTVGADILATLYRAQKKRGCSLEDAALQYLIYGVAQAKIKGKIKRFLANHELPEWLDYQVWESFVRHRAQIKKPFKSRANEIATITKLEAFHLAGHDAAAIIQQSIDNAWIGVFAIQPPQPAAAQLWNDGNEKPRAYNSPPRLGQPNQNMNPQKFANEVNDLFSDHFGRASKPNGRKR